MVVTGLVEYDEYLNKKLDKEGLILRIKNRLSIALNSIPYYHFGLYENLFTFKDTGADIKSALKDIIPNPTVTAVKGRITVTTVDISLEV